MSSSPRYSISKPQIIREQFDEEVVIVDLDTGSYYSLGGAGGPIWSAIESGASQMQIVELLAHSYNGEKAEIESSVARLLEELQAEELIVLCAPETESQIGSTPDQTPTPAPQSPIPDWQAPVLEKFTDMQALLLLDPIHEVDSAGWPQPLPPQPAMIEAQTNSNSAKA